MPILQATVTDEITRETFIRRQKTGGGPLMSGNQRRLVYNVVIFVLLVVLFALIVGSRDIIAQYFSSVFTASGSKAGGAKGPGAQGPGGGEL